MNWNGTQICCISLFSIKVLIARLYFSHHGWVLDRARICHMACQSEKPGQVAARGTWCPVSAAQHVNRSCLAATSRAPASPSVTSPLTQSGRDVLQPPPFQQVSAVPSTAPAVAPRLAARKLSSSRSDGAPPIHPEIQRGRDERCRGSELPNVTQVTEERMALLWMLWHPMLCLAWRFGCGLFEYHIDL